MNDDIITPLRTFERHPSLPFKCTRQLKINPSMQRIKMNLNDSTADQLHIFFFDIKSLTLATTDPKPKATPRRMRTTRNQLQAYKPSHHNLQLRP